MSKLQHPTPFQSSLLHLNEWFLSQSRQLPWRDRPEPYRVWISEIMLQQTQVATVIDYFNRFIQRFPTLQLLAEAEVEEVLALWSGLGYYSRARNLHKAARMMNELGGIPSTRKELEAMPGIGPYTAGAVLSIAFGQYEAILDGNLDRLFARMLQIGRDSRYKPRLWQVSRRVIRSAKRLELSPSVINQALMEIGALVCRPANPDCESCPLSTKCRSFKFGTVKAYPQPAPRRKFVHLSESRWFVTDAEGRFLVEMDPEARWRKGTWDLPAELPGGVDVVESASVRAVKLTVTHHKISRAVIPASLQGATLPPDLPDDRYRWIEEIGDLPAGAPLIKSLKAVRSH